MSRLIIVMHDQLSHSLPILKNCDKGQDVILMFERFDLMSGIQHHKKKICFKLSAMRHFAAELQLKNCNVHYLKFDSFKKSFDLKKVIRSSIKQFGSEKITMVEPSNFHFFREFKSVFKDLKIDYEFYPDIRFVCSRNEFLAWADGKKQLRMEFFYREMRKKYGILMEGSSPVGGKWNYDADNRKFPKHKLTVPAPFVQKEDAITRDVKQEVSNHFQSHFGDIEPFYFAVNRKQALKALNLFIAERLPLFGDYQDAMIEGEPWLYHSHISFYLNCGLLLPLECVAKAQQAYEKKLAPLNAVEGFIRQIIGWREYINGIYWLKMPEYEHENFLNASRSLPSFYWDGNTGMNCIKQCVNETKKNAYAHHIQRLMVLGNFALLAGISPQELNYWFLVVYADAYQWVELPNVSGMVLFADGGFLASKPYASGGAYINKMSNYCKNCQYSVKEKNGKSACPFNYLYWDFLNRHADLLGKNHRLAMIYRTYNRFSDEKKKMIARDAKDFLSSLD